MHPYYWYYLIQTDSNVDEVFALPIFHAIYQTNITYYHLVVKHNNHSFQINKIRKLAKKYHKPMKEDYLNTLTSVDKIDRVRLNDELKKADYYLGLAKSHYKLNNFQEAKNIALKASRLKKNWGEPHLLIGQIYANPRNNI